MLRVSRSEQSLPTICLKRYNERATRRHIFDQIPESNCALSWHRTEWWDKSTTKETFIFSTSTARLHLQIIKVHIRNLYLDVSVEANELSLISSAVWYLIEQFGMTGPESFLLTNRSGCLSVDGIDDVHDFSETLVSEIPSHPQLHSESYLMHRD